MYSYLSFFFFREIEWQPHFLLFLIYIRVKKLFSLNDCKRRLIYSGDAWVLVVSQSFWFLIWSQLMWPLYLLLNKILNIQDLVVEEGKPDGLVQPSSSSSSRKCEDAAAVLPCSHFVQVRKSKLFLNQSFCSFICLELDLILSLQIL